MSKGARLTLGISTLLIAAGFVVIGFTLGPQLPAGAMPFHVFGAICAAIGLPCLFWRTQNETDETFEIGTEETFEIEPTTHNSAKEPRPVFELDLGKLTAAGWFLLLSAFILVFVGAGVAPLLLPEDVGGRHRMKIAGAVIFFTVAAYFLGGRLLLKKLGFPILRN